MSKKIVILGAGESGVGAALLAKAKGYDYLLSDAGTIAEEYKKEIKVNDLAYEEGGHTEATVLGADLIVKSPGIPDSAQIIKKASEKGIPVISEIEFGYQHIHRSKKIIAITGTNGKTTTTLLTHHLMQACGFNAGLGGNVGHSFARLAIKDEHDFYVLEVSSFQLDGIDSFKPDVAVLLNITPDHLDRYDYQFENYVASKFRIVRNLGKEQAFIYCCDNKPITEQVSRRQIEASMFAISVAGKPQQDGGYLSSDHLTFNFDHKELKIPTSEVTLIGKHNMVNTMAAVLSVMFFEAPIHLLTRGLKSFVNAPHRLEKIASINGVTFINDSKATNVDSVYFALEGLETSIVLILGGVDKGNDYEPLKKLVKKKVRAIVGLGKDNAKIESFFSKHKEVISTDNINTAIQKAYEQSKVGDVVLLSPACASFDLFKNYQDRGEQFKAAVLALKKSIENHNKAVS